MPHVICPRCEGTGAIELPYEEDSIRELCPVCRGEGDLSHGGLLARQEGDGWALEGGVSRDVELALRDLLPDGWDVEDGAAWTWRGEHDERAELCAALAVLGGRLEEAAQAAE